MNVPNTFRCAGNRSQLWRVTTGGQTLPNLADLLPNSGS
jgi:hypothetical protein